MRIGVLTGGGDCPGLNAVIRAVVRTSDSRYGSAVVGFQDGWRGLLEDRRVQLSNDDRNDRLLTKGGTMLGTARTHPDVLRADADAVAFVRAFGEAGKPVAAICHGPWLLVESGLAKGRKVTSWPSVKTDLVNAGAQWEDAEVVVDGNLITSRKPDDIPAFNAAIVKAVAA